MKGLLIKDLQVLKPNLMIYCIIIALYFILFMSGDDIGILYSMITVLSTVSPITSLSYDEKSKFDHLAVTMPLTRKEIVISKYVLFLTINVVSSFICFTLASFNKNVSFDENTFTLLAVFLISTIFQSILLPVIYKFGTEKGRIVFFIFLIIPIIAIILFSVLNTKISINTIAFFEEHSNLIAIGIILTFILTYILSIIISIKIYTKKDL